MLLSPGGDNLSGPDNMCGRPPTHTHMLHIPSCRDNRIRCIMSRAAHHRPAVALRPVLSACEQHITRNKNPFCAQHTRAAVCACIESFGALGAVRLNLNLCVRAGTTTAVRDSRTKIFDMGAQKCMLFLLARARTNFTFRANTPALYR